MKALLALGIGGLLLAGCAAHPTQPESDQEYRVEWVGPRPLVGHSHVSMTFDGEGRAFGNAGCNHWFANYQMEGDKLTFSQPGSTRRMCAPAVMEQEQRFLALLGSVQRWDITEKGELRLWPETGRAIRMWPVD
ncbi:hypothetical protein PKB_1350 [Pseudomonas knackmussii B13]|uniref:DUF306 domain-containing protein n=1 Tax=Pseudomonas knackmussii (strain DSM 6978 / CCUG 54928 / LMG 23759 / B13) TaxID=1301098 RepID=A0A024HE22_PSEKB|nr:META domain-containing protein [Pseudomonas knackmussii]CDF82713.1 hypothetical protein PKB_1350 [Pseudomonas knackmussii B13]